MLVAYPPTAASENWLHDCLVELVRDAHTRAASGTSAPAWRDTLPAAYREELVLRTALRDRLADYEAVLQGLSPKARGQLVSALDQQNEIPALLSNAKDCCRAADFPPAAAKALQKLYTEAFRLLSELPTRDAAATNTDQSIRDRQYEIVYLALPVQFCAFCGCEYLDRPKYSKRDPAAREDLDHYLPRAIYPFAGVNLRNLMPMGDKCNARYKGGVDPIRRDGAKRPAFDPYGTVPAVTIHLDRSDPVGNGGGPQWDLELRPAGPELETWVEVFDVRRRWIEDVLAPTYDHWLTIFAYAYRCEHEVDVRDEFIVQELKREYARARMEGYADRAFLRTEVFRLLHERCAAGDADLLAFLGDLIREGVAA